ncbi:MAG: diaminopimelate epimerase [Faecalibacterium sp.]|nr:diaminopimelate epimerase [Faecalibacterium sp.]
MKLQFTKMQGCANDYIYVDCRSTGVPADIAALSVQLSARRFSVGADGIICICAGETSGADGKMRIFNADGSEAKMCGNGVRCVAQWLREHEPACADKPELRIDTLSGCKVIRYLPHGRWQVEMGQYSLQADVLPAADLQGELLNVPLVVDGHSWQVTCVNVGNPHCVTVVPDVDSLNLEQIGPHFEHHPCFPEGVNTEFVQQLDATHLKMRVWERGSGETWACGTGTCATVIAMVELGLCPADTDVAVQLRGGELTIRVDAAQKRVWMTGPAQTVYEGCALL